jgi:hypothetical protein
MDDPVTPNDLSRELGGHATSLATRRLRSAMFVDFDNVFSGLQRLDSEAAKSFAEDPARWVEALANGEDADGLFVRRFLVRKCYLNPAPFSRYRPNFTRAGFQVVDCPSLTQQGKSSADINLVLDAVDALGASTRFDEFVFLSADADFTPLVTRCRAADRQVTIITPGPAAAAYRAVADTVLAVDSFIGLLTTNTAVESGATPPETSAEAVEVAASTTLNAAALEAAAHVVRHLVTTSDGPVVLGTAAEAAQRACPGLLESGWNGTGSFIGWLHQVGPDLPFDTHVPGYVWDPSRFSEADLPTAPMATQGAAGLTELQRQVAGITDIPPLGRADYRLLLEQLAFDLALAPFSRSETSKRVRDECTQAGSAISRAVINFVINGLLLAGVDLRGEPTARQLATVWAENVLGLCQGARIELSDEAITEITGWVSGGLVAMDSD